MNAIRHILTFLSSLRQRHGLLLVIIAVVLLELLSGAQYYFTRRLLESELELRAEDELIMKAILIKSNLNDAEGIINQNIWKIQAHLDVPDSTFTTTSRMATFSPVIQGIGIAFEPFYYPEKGKWFEVYARNNPDGTVQTAQIGGEDHDYTKMDFYTKAIASGTGQWITPYYDKDGALELITSYAKPILDRNNTAVGVAAIDVSLKWLTDTIDSRHIYPSSFLMVLTETGIPVIYPSSERIDPETTKYVYEFINDSTIARQSSHSKRSKIIHFDIGQREGTIFYANMKGVPHWQIAVVCFDDEIFASLTKLRLQMLLPLIVAFGVLLFVVWLFAHDENILRQKKLEEERMDSELRVAGNIQQALLPEDDLTSADISDVQVKGRLIPAKAVGGDLYNAFMRDGKLYFCIGDVSGKGVPAAIIMAIVQALFRNIASHNHLPSNIMEQMNEASCRNNKNNIFVTLFIGVLDLPTGRLRYCNAGHELPFIVGEGTLNAKPNMPIGLFNDFKYEMQETIMQPGDILFLYTDGLTEARNTHREMFGRERVRQLMATDGRSDARALVENVITEVQRFAEGAEQSDDLTLLAIHYTPKEEQLVFDESLTLPNDVKEVTALSSFIKDVMTRLNLDKHLAFKLRLALEEAVVNIMKYAYPSGTKGDVSIRITSDGKRLKFILSDAGIFFNPTEAATADTTLSAEDRPIGGLGILLIRKLMDSINYERTEGRNELTLTKTINSKTLIQ